MKKCLLITLSCLCVWLMASSQDGSLDNSFGTGGKQIYNFGFPYFDVQAGCLQPDGKIIVAGGASNEAVNKTRDFFLARFLPDGTLDNSFGNNGISYAAFGIYDDEFVSKVIVKSDGSILAGGTNYKYTSYNGFTAVCKFKSNGQVDSSFGNNGRFMPEMAGPLGDMVLQPDGKILLSTQYPGHILRINTDGTVDHTFTYNQFNQNNTFPFASKYMKLYPDGKILVAGAYSHVSNSGSPYFLKLRPNGVLDSSFGTNGLKMLDTILVYDEVIFTEDNQGRLLRCTSYGSFYNDSLELAITRYLPSGEEDISFGTQGTVSLDAGTNRFFRDPPTSFQVLANGKILFGGLILNEQGIRQMAAIRLQGTGS